MAMRRRVVSAKKLPSKKSKAPDLPQTSNYLHIKLACGWGLLVFLDAIVGFRLEYLYPAIMFLRSVLDSYKYHGLIFSLFFIMLVLYLDIICWTVLIGPWLFFMASACVWLELIRSWDSSFGYGSMLLWLLFLYVEVSQRLTFLPPSIVTLLRPFGAHCIGYPVVTMSFQLKHQLTHVIRMRQQRHVSEENSRCFDILLKALPLEEDDIIEDHNGGGGKVSPLLSSEDTPTTNNNNNDSRNNKLKLSTKSLGGGGGASNNNNKSVSSSGGNNIKTQSSKSHVNNNNKTVSSNYVGVVTSTNKRDTSPTNKSHDINKGTNTPLLWKQGYSAEVTLIPNGTTITGAGASPTVNGDIPSRPLSAGKIPPTSSTAPMVGLKKQALVKAVPRTDLQQQMDAREKAAKSAEALLVELKEERALRLQTENENIRLEKEVKHLQADLHATSLQEQEANERLVVVTQQERLSRAEAQRLRHESESLQNRLAKLSSSKTQDLGNISTLEDQLKQELTQRRRLESQLREQRSQASTQSQWSKEEMKELKEKLNKRERDLAQLQNELQQFQKKYQNVCQTVSDKAKENSLLVEQNDHLKVSLADETRVKIELFQYLSEARKKHEGMMDEIKKRDQEIEALKQKLHHMVAIHSTWTPSLPSPHH